MKTVTLTFNKKPSYLTIKNIISEVSLKEKLNNKQLLNRYGKLLLALSLYYRGELNYPHKDCYLLANIEYAEEFYKKELERRDLLDRYTFFIERLN
jgi:hypothetical protein